MNGCDYCDGACENCTLDRNFRRSLGEQAKGVTAERRPDRVRHDGEDHDVHEPDMGGEG